MSKKKGSSKAAIAKMSTIVCFLPYPFEQVSNLMRLLMDIPLLLMNDYKEMYLSNMVTMSVLNAV